MADCKFESSEIGFVCNLEAMNREERVRHAELARKLLAASDEKQQLDDGFVFRISNGKSRWPNSRSGPALSVDAARFSLIASNPGLTPKRHGFI
ncbi:MAG TPA: hypothetical protein VIX59_18260 [Candidatus Binataceae bacterium]